MTSLISRTLSRALPFFVVRGLLRVCYRVDVKGLENFHAAGERSLIVANHVSKIDALLLSAFLPGRIIFATQADLAFRWWLKPYWHIGDSFSLDQANPLTAKKMVDALKQGRRCMIFPEGRQSRDGSLMKVYDSPGMIAEKANAVILPVRIDGPQYTPFSATSCGRKRLFPKITLTILPAAKVHIPDAVKGKARRKIAGTMAYDILERAMVEGVPYSTMLRQLLASRSVRGGGNVILEDPARKPLTHNQFVTQFFALSRALGSLLGKDEKTVGIMMPNGIPNATTIFALQALDRITALVNFTSGPVRIVQACQMAPMQTVVTLRGFINALQLTPITDALTKANIKVVYLEDVLAKMTVIDRLTGFLKAHLPLSMAARGLSKDTNAPALMLFTSGTTGKPKGVMLSHKNIISNGFQFGMRVGFTPNDSTFACLPMFHSFGLTLGFFLPMFAGTHAFLFPSPIRYHDIPELVYDTKATLLLGTDTFLANYEKHAHPHDFYFLRFAIGGAEKIKPETRRVWAEKFGVRLFEGYGTTEASPVISVNSPMYYKAGTIGRAVAGMDVKLSPVEGIKDGAELVVKGINVMLGYVKDEAPGVIQPPAEGWYNTGDVVSIDDDGFITILGRTKRFAKVAGEMVSLGAIEAVVSAIWPGVRQVAVSVPHERKGEQVVLLTETEDIDLGVLAEKIRSFGLTELSLPRKLVRVAQIPLLGSGKTDYVKAKLVAQEAILESVSSEA